MARQRALPRAPPDDDESEDLDLPRGQAGEIAARRLARTADAGRSKLLSKHLSHDDTVERLEQRKTALELGRIVGADADAIDEEEKDAPPPPHGTGCRNHEE